MSDFQACADAIRHRGFDEAAGVVEQLAGKRPKLFAAVAVRDNGYGDEVQSLHVNAPRLFLTRKGANREAQRLTCEFLRTAELREVLERLEDRGRQVDTARLSSNLTRILGQTVEVPGTESDYHSLPRGSQPLVPVEADDDQMAEVAKFLKLKLFRAVSVPCDTHLITPPVHQPVSIAVPAKSGPTSQANLLERFRAILTRRRS